MTPSHRLINKAINRWLSKTLAARTALTRTTPLPRHFHGPAGAHVKTSVKLYVYTLRLLP